jgi:hypothetical protein
MGTETRARSSAQNTQTKIGKTPRCSVCRKVYTPACDWNQGRCPHHPSLIDQISSNTQKSRFYNLIKFFKGKK